MDNFDPDAPATQRDIKWLAELVAENRNLIAAHNERFDQVNERFDRVEDGLQRIESMLHAANFGQQTETLEKHDRRITALETAFRN